MLINNSHWHVCLRQLLSVRQRYNISALNHALTSTQLKITLLKVIFVVWLLLRMHFALSRSLPQKCCILFAQYHIFNQIVSEKWKDLRCAGICTQYYILKCNQSSVTCDLHISQMTSISLRQEHLINTKRAPFLYITVLLYICASYTCSISGYDLVRLSAESESNKYKRGALNIYAWKCQ